MGQVRFIRPDEATYVRVMDMFDVSTPEGQAMVDKLPDAELHHQETRTYFDGSESELQLFEIRCSPNTQFHPHAHNEDEILYVVDGQLNVGSRSYPAGSAVYVPAGTLYVFGSGPDGLRVLNFRPRKDSTYLTREELKTNLSRSESV